jgi:hypothetical protein
MPFPDVDDIDHLKKRLKRDAVSRLKADIRYFINQDIAVDMGHFDQADAHPLFDCSNKFISFHRYAHKHLLVSFTGRLEQ